MQSKFPHDLTLTFAFEFLLHFEQRSIALDGIKLVIATHWLERVRSAQHDLLVGDTRVYSNVILTVRVVLPLQYTHLTMRLRRRPLDAIIAILVQSCETQVVNIVFGTDKHRVVVNGENLKVIGLVAEKGRAIWLCNLLKEKGERIRKKIPLSVNEMLIRTVCDDPIGADGKRPCSTDINNDYSQCDKSQKP